MIRRSLWSLLLPALFVVCAQAQAQNATGTPGVTAADGTNLTTTGPNEDSVLTAAQGTINDPDSITTFTPTWQWQQADAPASGTPADSAYSAITGETAATFTPLQAHVGKFLRVCAAFDDDAGNDETRCWSSAAAVVNVNDAPVADNNTIYVRAGGRYVFSADDFPFTDEDGSALGVMVAQSVPALGAMTVSVTGISNSVSAGQSFTAQELAEGLVTYTPPDGATAMAGYANFEYSIRTETIFATNCCSNNGTITIDLVPATAVPATGTATVTAASGIAYHEGVELTAGIGTVADANGIPTHRRSWQWQSALAQAGTYADIDGATVATFTPAREHVGQYIRACLRFTDGINTAEMRCSAGNVIARANSVSVPITASESEPYRFKPSDFAFPGEDVGMLVSIRIVTTIESGTGTLHLAGASRPITNRRGSNLLANTVQRLIYYPPPDSAVTPNFASFTYTMNYGGPNTETRTMNINLVEHLRLRLRVFLEGPLR